MKGAGVKGAGVVLATHDRALAEAVADRAVWLGAA